MSVQNSSNRSSGGSCLLTALIMISLCLALLVGAAGGAMLDNPLEQAPREIPNIPAPAPETLNYQPSVQTFAEPAVDQCPDPSQKWAGWEDGVGGVLPPCWTREQQNVYMRSH